MSTAAAGTSTEVPRASWAPMAALALAQVLMSFDVASLPVAMGGMVESFGVPPTTISTGIVMYGLAVAALVTRVPAARRNGGREGPRGATFYL